MGFNPLLKKKTSNTASRKIVGTAVQTIMLKDEALSFKMYENERNDGKTPSWSQIRRRRGMRNARAHTDRQINRRRPHIIL